MNQKLRKEMKESILDEYGNFLIGGMVERCTQIAEKYANNAAISFMNWYNNEKNEWADWGEAGIGNYYNSRTEESITVSQLFELYLKSLKHES